MPLSAALKINCKKQTSPSRHCTLQRSAHRNETRALGGPRPAQRRDTGTARPHHGTRPATAGTGRSRAAAWVGLKEITRLKTAKLKTRYTTQHCAMCPTPSSETGINLAVQRGRGRSGGDAALEPREAPGHQVKVSYSIVCEKNVMKTPPCNNNRTICEISKC